MSSSPTTGEFIVVAVVWQRTWSNGKPGKQKSCGARARALSRRGNLAARVGQTSRQAARVFARAAAKASAGKAVVVTSHIQSGLQTSASA